ncbi:MAG: stage V sporulation protein AD [Bacilli bacterium]|jgi:stage V sporulation protein AD|nr:stage V sporulation protein AD [Bacilli bacterium]
MTFKYNHVYLNASSTVVGPNENQGPLKDFFDKKFSDFYAGEKSWEQAEIKMMATSINILLHKLKKAPSSIDLLIAGDLLDQIAPSSFVAANLKIPFLGIYSACATMAEAMIIGSNMLEAKQINNIICATSSHNLSAEKQFRYPSEYGAPKPKTATFTATGGAAAYLSRVKNHIKIESATIGKVIDLGQKDANHTGAAMAPAAADTIYTHFKNLKRNINHYDLILTGDLGLYGKEILINYLKEEYQIDIEKKYNDCGIMLYDLDKQNVGAGASGPVSSALVTFGYIIKQMTKKKFKKVLLVATGALFSPTFLFQSKTIPAVAHAIDLEVVE